MLKAFLAIGSVIFIILIILFIYNLNLPSTTHTTTDTTSYMIEHKTAYTYYTHSQYAKINITKEIKNFGFIKSPNQLQYIFIDYSPYILENDSIEVKLLDKSNKTYYYNSNTKQFVEERTKKEYYFGNLSFNYDKQIITFVYREKDLENVHAINIEGYNKTLFPSDQFAYYNNLEKNKKPCNETDCVFEINISNNLDRLILIKEDNIFDLQSYNLKNISDCKFTQMKIDLAHSDYYVVNPDCRNNECNSWIEEENTTHNIVNKIQFDIEDNFITSTNMIINKPINMQIKLYVNCD